MTDLNCGPDPAAVDIGLGIFLVVGTIAAYIPQVNTLIMPLHKLLQLF